MAMNRGKAANGFSYKGGILKRNLGDAAAMGMSVVTVMMQARATTDIQEALPASLDFNYYEVMFNETRDR